MRVLAIDTALAACSVAVFDTASGGIRARESVPMVRGHAEALMPLIERAMKHSRLKFAELDRIAVTTGPGSFTGLRVGISAARGIAVAAEKPAVGVTTLRALAAPHLADDHSGPVVAAIDARHEHVYLQVFGASGRTLVEPQLVSLQDAVRAAAGQPALIVGSAASAVAAGLAELGREVTVDARAAPDIDWVARVGAALPEGQSPPRPQYLRAADAQPQHAAQIPRRR